jgi:hypothetical protein
LYVWADAAVLEVATQEEMKSRRARSAKLLAMVQRYLLVRGIIPCGIGSELFLDKRKKRKKELFFFFVCKRGRKS